MKPSIKFILGTAILGTVTFGGIATLVSAQPRSIVAIVPERLITEKNDGEANDDIEDAKKLQAFAKISAEQAQRTVESAEKIKASRVTLENDDGNLVYAVVIGQKEVKVDAGNGKILYTEALQNGEDNETETYPRSSIQVPEAEYDK